jgi:hypothetical protein
VRALALLAVASCSYFKKPPPVVEPPSGTPVVAQLDRGACFGACPVYSVVVYGDGTVIYAGETHVKVTGRRSRKLGKPALDQIASAFEKGGFASMAASYEKTPEEDPATVSVTFRGKTVVRASGDPSTPDGLYQAEDALETITGIDEWTGLETKARKQEREKKKHF